MFKNEYVLKVDIKRKMTAIVPTFVQNDTAILVFKVYDNGKPFDLTNYTRAEVTHKRKDGQVVIGLASIERLGSEDIVKYQYMGNEMSKEGFVDTTLTLFSNNTRVSIQPFQISIVADIRDAIGAQEEFGVLQDLIAEVSDTKSLIDSKISEIDKAVVDTNQALVDITTAKEEAEIATTNANSSATNANTKADLADQKAILADNAASNADAKASLAQQATNNASIATTEALNAKDATVLAIENAEEATSVIQTLSSNMKHTGDYINNKQYYKGNEARQNGSTFVATQNSLGNPPPLPPATSNSFWEMRAQRGVDGEGSVSSVNGMLPDPDGNVNLGNLSTSWNNLTEKPPVFPPSVHVHNISDVDGLQIALDNAGTKDVATQIENGLMAKEDKTKLDGIETGANKYVHPTTHPASIIEQDSNNRMLSDAKIAEIEAKETVEGAQSKADTAESNAKIHTDNKIGLLSDKLTSRLEDLAVSVKSFGAKGDGITDDTIAIQNAVEYAFINNLGTIRFPNASNYYFITNPIVSKSNLKFVGDSGKPFIKNETESVFNLFEVDGVENLSFENLSFQNGIASEGSHLGAGKNGISIINSKDIVIKDCFFTEMNGASAVSAYKTNGLYVDDCVFYRCTYSMLSLGMEVENVFVNRSIFDTLTTLTHSNAYTISTGSNDYITPHKFLVRNVHVTNCKLLNNPRWEGFDTHGGKGIYIENNHIENVRAGIMAKLDSRPNVPFEHGDIYIRNNTIVKGEGNLTGSAGIVVGGDDTGSLSLADNIHITGNKIIGDFGFEGNDNTAGIYIANVENFYVKDNIVDGSIGKSFVCTFSIFGEISGNQFLNTIKSTNGTTRPIRFLNPSYHVVFKNNVIRNSAPLPRVQIGVFSNQRGLVAYEANIIDADTLYSVTNAMMSGILNINKIGTSGVYAKNQQGVITHYCTDNKIRSVDSTLSDFTVTGGTGDTALLTSTLSLMKLCVGEEIIIIGAGTSGGDLTTTFSKYINKDKIIISDPIVTAITNAQVKTIESTWAATTV